MEVFMNLNSKAMKEAAALVLSVVMMGVIAGTADSQPAMRTVAEVPQARVAEENITGRTAGVVLSLNELEEQALTGVQVAAYEQTQTIVVAAAAEAIESIPEGPLLTEEEMLWQNRVMADVEEKMNVRAEASADAEIVGRFRKGDVAEVVEIGAEWTHIKSGNVDGYVKNEYCIYGLDALAYANKNIDVRATITGNGVRVRSEASTESSVVAAVSTGTVLIVETDAEVPAGWLAVRYTGKTRYINAEFAEVEHATTEAITIAEEKEIERKKAEEAAKRKAAQTTEVTVVQNASVYASTDEVLLLAALIQCEAGGESYDGKLAVGAVVMNRLRSGRYGSAISDVIYAPGQFTPAGNGKVATVLANGPKASCIQAAQEAINGVDNTGGAKSFKNTRSGHAGVVIGNHVFF